MLKLRIEKKVNGQNVTSNYDSILSYAKETMESVSHATVVPFAFPDLKAEGTTVAWDTLSMPP